MAFLAGHIGIPDFQPKSRLHVDSLARPSAIGESKAILNASIWARSSSRTARVNRSQTDRPRSPPLGLGQETGVRFSVTSGIRWSPRVVFDPHPWSDRSRETRGPLSKLNEDRFLPQEDRLRTQAVHQAPRAGTFRRPSRNYAARGPPRHPERMNRRQAVLGFRRGAAADMHPLAVAPSVRSRLDRARLPTGRTSAAAACHSATSPGPIVRSCSSYQPHLAETRRATVALVRLSSRSRSGGITPSRPARPLDRG